MGRHDPRRSLQQSVDKLLYRISDPAVPALLANGKAYVHASRPSIFGFEGTVRGDIVGVYRYALKMIWVVCSVSVRFEEEFRDVWRGT
jgi:hypothetical protein